MRSYLAVKETSSGCREATAEKDGPGACELEAVARYAGTLHGIRR